MDVVVIRLFWLDLCKYWCHIPNKIIQTVVYSPITFTKKNSNLITKDIKILHWTVELEWLDIINIYINSKTFDPSLCFDLWSCWRTFIENKGRNVSQERYITHQWTCIFSTWICYRNCRGWQQSTHNKLHKAKYLNIEIIQNAIKIISKANENKKDMN